MKGAFLISEDPGIFGKVRDALVRAGAIATDDDVVQLRDEQGNLVTVFGRIPPGTEWEWQEGPFTLHGQVAAPGMERATACWIESRSERAVSVIVHKLAAEIGSPTWLLDSASVLWPASDIDAELLRL